MFGFSISALLNVAHVVFLTAIAIAAAASIAALHLSARMKAAADRELAQLKSEAFAELESAKAAAAQASAYAASVEEEAKLARARSTQLQEELEAEKNERAARILTPEQTQILGELKGQIRAVNITSANNAEPLSFAALLTRALTNAEVEVTYYQTPPGMAWAGVMIYAPDIPNDPNNHPLIRAFERAGILTGVSRVPLLPDGPADMPMIHVGLKDIEYVERPNFLGSDVLR
jgi:hypothetical protein